MPITGSNAATRVVVSTLGVLVGIGSIDHGALEMMQGNRPTPGLIVNALGSGYRWTVWTHGGEGAFTLIPNFLATGFVATLIGVALIVWSLRFIHRQRGPTVFLLLSISSFLAGGGVAQLGLFTLAWAGATRIRARLRFWRWLLPRTLRRFLGGLWRWTLAAATTLFLIALEIAVFGYVPGVSDPTQILHTCWTILLAGLVLFLLSFLGAFAHDIEDRDTACGC